MKQLSLLSLLFVLFLTSACVDDDGGNPIAFIGRADGWVIDNVDTDFGAKATAAINALTDEEIADEIDKQIFKEIYKKIIERSKDIRINPQRKHGGKKIDV